MNTHYRKTIMLVVGVVATVVLAGCTAVPAGQPVPTTSATRAPVEVTTLPSPSRQVTPAGTPAPGAVMQVETQAALDLAGRLNVPAERVELISVNRTEMPTGSLGCGPTDGVGQPGLIIGDEIILRAGGLEYTYRSDGRRLVPCSPAAFPGGRDSQPLAGSRPAEFNAQNAALDDLAQRLGIAKSGIQVIQAEAVEWPDASLGCSKPGRMYAQVITPGYRIVLEAAGKRYEYHSGRGTHIVSCEK
ncbi:MAG: hypothetical protein NT169_13010 [Chloroflexi bacterium]|nr:hypothetical protein [Chloroflexota bacterium]